MHIIVRKMIKFFVNKILYQRFELLNLDKKQKDIDDLYDDIKHSHVAQPNEPRLKTYLMGLER
ncbi:CLUMA_CG001433, isoform A [Clunio marinus]|uniref:CLUMA_CG001433, isoform A n=1 Tax=Clunio marinus TaxID=568069 RepID=A0A1J1HI03_9DIPT|nr:CLUMA_CG001433, isoform A [Clunio marinus]